MSWLGRDDNKPAGLTGGAGAMQVWADVMVGLESRPLQPIQPADIQYAWVDAQGLLSGPDCENSVQLPFVRGTLPTENSSCTERGAAHVGKDVIEWVRGLFD